ncbi:protein TonB [Flavobacterium sp. HSC-32F16]|uniref:energy transducer TonB n=1 Tax=Flavobacterium sp. HSC-32F16 TaxID=2910964 RepID=UPI0020A29528|nr:hypothetical protein [Flavobacterium sp. HSC-32F16]MCP2026747.1 protein TonB [Flavobacterium sp. HSC-32F16]
MYLVLNFKRLVFVLLSVFFNNYSFSQESAASSNKKHPNFIMWREVEIKPEFIGGIEKFYKYVGNNFHEINTNLSGKIVAEFIIETDGCLSNFKIIENELGVESGKEYIRVLQNCPRWIPGYNDDKKVRVKHHLPIIIQKGM